MPDLTDGWYWCDITEPRGDEPDWSRVPEERREVVRQRWLATNVETRRWKLWGPQIGFFAAQYAVSVIGRVE